MEALSTHRPLLAAFYAGDAPERVVDGLGDALAAACAAGHREWPDLSVEDPVFCQFLGERITAEELAPDPAAVPITDLYLACACAGGVPGASARLVDRCGDTVAAAIARVLDPADRDEAAQRTWASLLVADDDRPPKIAQYKGRGPLHAFVRVAAVRIALTLRRRTRPAGADDLELDRIADDTDDPELRYLKQLYRDEFRRSFAAAFEALAPHHQLLLRLDVVERLTIDQAAAVYGRSRTTTGRHLLEARQALARGTLADLQARLDLPASELQSLARLVRSQIELSVERLLVAP